MDERLVDSLAKKIWDYHHMNHQLEKADCVLVMGSFDVRVAERGAEIFLSGLAPLIIFSGGNGRFTEKWDRTEAEIFSDVAKARGVPEDKILLEKESRNSGENLLFTKRLLEKSGLDLSSFILVHKPYMERRAYATFKNIFPENQVIVTSPQISLEDYPTEEVPRDKVISDMVGDLQRIKLYPEKGFQVPQEIPDDVWGAYEKLVGAGFTDSLVE